MPIDVKQFATDLGLSTEDQAALFALFDKNPQVNDKLTGLMTAQVESALAPLRTDLERKNKDLDAQFQVLESVRGTDSATLDAAHKDYEQAMVAQTIAQERIRRMATSFGTDPEPWLKDLPVPQAGRPAGTPAQPQNVDTPMDSNKILATAGLQVWNGMRSMAEMNDLASEHTKLFGQPLAQQALLDRLQDRVKRTGNGNLTLRDVWRDEYKVVEKEREIQETDLKRRESEAYERGKREASDAAALGTSVNQAPQAFVHSPVLAGLTKDQPTHVNGLPEGVVAAIADYRQRRLNQKTA